MRNRILFGFAFLALALALPVFGQQTVNGSNIKSGTISSDKFAPIEPQSLYVNATANTAIPTRYAISSLVNCFDVVRDAIPAADPLGLLDSTSAFRTAYEIGGHVCITNAGLSGGANYKIAGTGPDSGGVGATITKTIDVDCSPGVRIFTDDLDNDFFRMSVPANGAGLPAQGIGLHFNGHGGCRIDQSAQRGSTSMPFGAGTAKAWDSTITYSVSVRVTRGGNLYTALNINTNDPPPSSNWVQNTPYYPPIKQGTSATDDGLSIVGFYDTGGTYTVDPASDTFTRNAHGIIPDQGITFTNVGGTLPAPIVANSTVYYAVSVTANTFKVSATKGGSPVDITTGGTGTNSVAVGHSGIETLIVEGMEFYSGTHWQVAGGDGSLFFNGCKICIVRNNSFIGSRDVGIYASSVSPGEIEMFTDVYGNRFVNDFGGVAIKRSMHGFQIHENNFTNDVICAAAEQITNVGYGDKQGGIHHNRFDGCQIEVRLDYVAGVSVDHNQSENYGAVLADGVTPVQAYGPVAYRLQGVTRTSLDSNVSLSVKPAYVSLSPSFITLDSYDPGSGSVNSTFNDISNNTSSGFHSAGSEAAADHNRFSDNYEFLGTVHFIGATGTGSSSRRYDWANGFWDYMTPVLFDDLAYIGRRGDPTTHISFDTGTILFTTMGTLRATLTGAGFSIVGPVLTSVGTCASPSYTFNAELGLGMFRLGTHKLGFCSNNVPSIYLDDTNGLNIIPKASSTPANNGEMTFQLTNDTTLVVKAKGSDGVVRSVSFTLN